MKHHIERAKHVYEERGVKDLAKTTLSYIPIELNNLIFWLQHGSGTRVMEEDWDTLILLDGCRYDMFANTVDISGNLESRISLGSTSEEFLERNFDTGPYDDTVYVNSNPYPPSIGLYEGTFHAVVDLLKEWNDELQTVHPETVVNAAIEAHEEYPNKRHIVHFMQPHFPFIGDYGKEIAAKGWSLNEGHSVPVPDTVWQQLRKGQDQVSEEVVLEAYYENLDIVLDHVENLLDAVSGRIVISADHGNMVGERIGPFPTRKKYGHYYGVYTVELVKVPWFIIEKGERREIQTDLPSKEVALSKSTIENRLSALGYK